MLPLNTITAKTYKIFVGCIPGKTTDEEIEALFKDYPSLLNVHLERRKNKKCSGYGHIELADAEDYEAILSGKHILGERQLTTMPYLEKNDLIQSQLKFNKRRIVIAQLPKETTDQDLHRHFSKFGRIEKAFVVQNEADPELKPYGHVIYKDDKSAAKAKKKSHRIRGRRVQIKTHKIDIKKKLKNLGSRNHNETPRVGAELSHDQKTAKKTLGTRLKRQCSGSASKLSRSFIVLNKGQIQKDILRLSEEIRRSSHHNEGNVRFNRTNSQMRGAPVVDFETLDIAYLSYYLEEEGRIRHGKNFSLF